MARRIHPLLRDLETTRSGMDALRRAKAELDIDEHRVELADRAAEFGLLEYRLRRAKARNRI